MMPTSSTVLDYLGTPAAVGTFGAIAAALLATSVCRQRASSGVAASSRRSEDTAGGPGAEEVAELDRTRHPGGHLAVYYGTQTGTAQLFAKQIAAEAEQRGFRARVVDLQDAVEDAAAPSDGAADDEDEDADRADAARLLRAALACPRHRDPDDLGGGPGADEGEGEGEGGRSKALFLVATYGEGDPTDNAEEFAAALKRTSGLPSYTATEAEDRQGDASDPGLLRDVDYAVFGLGNRQYEHYNNMGRFVDAALGRCGARRVAALGLGDDDDDLEGDFEAWKDGVLWPALTERYGDNTRTAPTPPNGRREGPGPSAADAALPPCPYVVEYLDDPADRAAAAPDPSSVQTVAQHYVQAVDCPVTARRELRDPSDPGSTVHLEIDISQHADALAYRTADNLGVLPLNDAATVEAVAAALGYDLDRTFRLLPNAAASAENGGAAAGGSSRHALPFPTPCTVRECLSRYCDLAGPPRRSDLKQFAPHARAALDRQALERLSRKEGRAEYKEKITAAHVGVADLVTRLCPSIACDLARVVALCPRLQPRYYTLASSASVHPTTVHVTCAVQETARPAGAGPPRRGVCSGHLADRKVGEAVRVFVRASAFRDKRPEAPLLMVGPGTGVAPMRALLQERAHARATAASASASASASAAAAPGPSVLYFGCKRRSMDYLYRDELEAFVEGGTLAELHLAFSREQPEKVYVQHLLARRAADTWRLIHEEGAAVFVCGGVRMGADVQSALQDIVSECGKMARGDAKAYLDEMAAAGRFVQELWA